MRGRTDRWSHLLADDPDELHAMAAALGIPRRGYQQHRRSAALNHYDLPETLRRRADHARRGARDVAPDGAAHAVVAARWRSASSSRSPMIWSKE